MVSMMGAVGGGAVIGITIKAIDDFSNTFKKLDGSLSSLAGVAGKAGVTAIAGVGVALTGVGIASLKAAGDFEQTKIAFTTMLGSAEEADKMLRDIADFAKKTPFELKGLEEQTKKLLAYGISSKEVLGDIKILGDISAGVGLDKLPQLTLAFGQVSAAGKLTGQELRQFTESGVPLLDALATSLGKTPAEIQQLVSAGEIGFTDVKNALSGLTEEGGRFENLMAKQADTVQGKFSNLQDTFQLMLRDIGTAFLPAISELADVFSTQLLPAIQPLIPVLGVFFTDVIETLAPLIAELVPHLVKFVEFAIKLYDAIMPLLPPIMELAFVILDALIEILEPLIPVIQDLVPTISDLFLAFVPIVPVLANLIKLLVEIIAVPLKNLGPAIEIILPILEALIFFFNQGIEAISILVGWIKDLVEWIGKIHLGVLSEIGDFIGGGIKGVGKIIGVDDAIIRPNGDIIKTHPQDTLIATKNPGGLGGNIYVTIESVNGLDADAVAEALQIKLKNVISI